MKHQQLMTAILNDGSQITGTEISKNIHGDEIVLSSDGQEIPINMFLCTAYYAETDPTAFDELSPSEAAELEKMVSLSSLLTYQAY